MDWPKTPVERLSNFTPGFCPRPACSDHLHRGPGYRFNRHGFFRTRRGRTVTRFLCLRCRHTFSTQTFSTTYYLKRPDLLLLIGPAHQAGSADRQIARSLRCNPSTVTGQIARLGRHAMLLNNRARHGLRGRMEQIPVLDHFETFEFTQDYPVAVATAVATGSWFVLSLDPALHRRAGRVSAHQRKRLARRPARRAHEGYARSAHRTFDTLLPLLPPGKPLVIRTDDHKAYERARRTHPRASDIRLEVHPNPPRGEKGSPRSPEARLRDRRMFPVDLLHKILRHTHAHERRETIAFSRRVNSKMERLEILAVWRNFMKGRSERRVGSETPAMALGLSSERWGWDRVLSQRLFYHREPPLPEPWPELYRREWSTPLLERNTTHALSRAF